MFRTATAIALFAALPAFAAPPLVATDIAPVRALVAAVIGDVGEVPAAIVPPGADPHGLALKPSQARALENADVVVWIGPELTPWLEGPLETLADGAVHLGLLDVEGTMLMDVGEEHDDHDEHAEGDDHDAHAHEGIDPHAWLDPTNAALWATTIAEVLSKADPENAEAYRANAARFGKDIAAADARVTAAVLPMQGVAYANSHDAFGYFEARFGVEPIVMISDSDAVSPGPARLARVRDEIREHGVACMFTEASTSSSLVATALEGSDVRVIPLDPLGDGADYVALLDGLAAGFAACLD